MAYSTMTNRAAGYIVAESDWDDITNNFDALNSAFRIDLTLTASIVPLSGIDGASLELVESSGAGTAKPVLYGLRFDDSTDEGRMWVAKVPRLFGGNPTLKGSYKMTGANTSKSVGLVCQVAAVSDGDTHSTVEFDTANTLTESVPDTADESDEFEITLTNNDNMAADDWLCIILYRDVDASDDAVGDFILTSLALHYTLAA